MVSCDSVDDAVDAPAGELDDVEIALLLEEAYQRSDAVTSLATAQPPVAPLPTPPPSPTPSPPPPPPMFFMVPRISLAEEMIDPKPQTFAGRNNTLVLNTSVLYFDDSTAAAPPDSQLSTFLENVAPRLAQVASRWDHKRPGWTSLSMEERLNRGMERMRAGWCNLLRIRVLGWPKQPPVSFAVASSSAASTLVSAASSAASSAGSSDASSTGSSEKLERLPLPLSVAHIDRLLCPSWLFRWRSDYVEACLRSYLQKEINNNVSLRKQWNASGGGGSGGNASGGIGGSAAGSSGAAGAGGKRKRQAL